MLELQESVESRLLQCTNAPDMTDAVRPVQVLKNKVGVVAGGLTALRSRPVRGRVFHEGLLRCRVIPFDPGLCDRREIGFFRWRVWAKDLPFLHSYIRS
jgi:hypothetical protein